jgi:hypothetical protein
MSGYSNNDLLGLFPRKRRRRKKCDEELSKWLFNFVNEWAEITDHHSALRFLDPTYDENTPVPDDYVIALAGAKKGEADTKSNHEKVDKAVRLIAENRKSTALHA